jgi:hypothetical protein
MSGKPLSGYGLYGNRSNSALGQQTRTIEVALSHAGAPHSNPRRWGSMGAPQRKKGAQLPERQDGKNGVCRARERGPCS